MPPVPLVLVLFAAERSSSAATRRAQRVEGMHAEGVYVGWSAGLGARLIANGEPCFCK